MFKSILVVDDDPAAALDAKLRLQRMGFSIAGPCLSPQQALELDLSQVDLALVDLQLPGVHDGLYAARMLKKRSIPIVFMSASQDPKIWERAREVDAFGYLYKPLKDEDLKETLQVALSRSQLGAQLKALESLPRPQPTSQLIARARRLARELAGTEAAQVLQAMADRLEGKD